MLVTVRGRRPRLAAGVWIAPTAVVTGEVEIGSHSSIWFNTVVRGDAAPIIIGAETNIQDGCAVHAIHEKSRVNIGNRVSVGHLCILHGCEVHDGVLIGMGSLIMDGAVIGENCLVAAGSLVTAGSRFDSGDVIMGRPAKATRKVTPDELRTNEARIRNYLMFVDWYRESTDGSPTG